MGSTAIISVNPEWDHETLSERVRDLRAALGDAELKPRGGNWFAVDADAFAGVGSKVMEGFVLRSGSLPDAVDLPTASPAQAARAEGRAASVEQVAGDYPVPDPEVSREAAAEARAAIEAKAPPAAPPAPAKASTPTKKAAPRKTAAAKKAAPAKKAPAKKAAATKKSTSKRS